MNKVTALLDTLKAKNTEHDYATGDLVEIYNYAGEDLSIAIPGIVYVKYNLIFVDTPFGTVAVLPEEIRRIN